MATSSLGVRPFSPFLSSFLSSATSLAILPSRHLKPLLIMSLKSFDFSFERLLSLTRVSTTLDVIKSLPAIPGHHENEPSPFCNERSFEVKSDVLYDRVFSSRYSASCRLRSVSFSASATQGVSFRSMVFSSPSFASLLANELSVTVSLFHNAMVFAIIGEEESISLPNTLAKIAADSDAASLLLGLARVGMDCMTSHNGLAVYSMVSFLSLLSVGKR